MFSLPKDRPSGLDSPITVTLIKWMSKLQVSMFRSTRGRIGSTWRIGAGFNKPVPVLLLNHRGRVSGKQFTTPLLFMQEGASLVVVGSQGGLPKDPQWHFNLRAHPDTSVELPGRGVVRVRARTAEPTERSRLWPKLVELYADFATYQTWTDRQIPVVILDPF
jgi:deazaflavin-dependent oxidoreductase (nitroreductase family)